MVYNLLNHIQGKNGSRWAKFVGETGIDNVLVLAIDAAKYMHKAMICTFYGDILVRPFEFDASSTGFEKVKQSVLEEKAKHQMKEIVVGIETTGHYYEDLVRRCQEEQFNVRVINAATTAKEREALLNWSKTDNLDLLAIVQSVINGRGTFHELPSGTVYELRKLTRARRVLVDKQTSVRNEIRVYADYIFREFQGKSVWHNGKRERVKPFSKLFGKASRYIMRNCLHPSDILDLGEEGLRQLSIRENLKLRDTSIDMLLDFAKDSISRPKEEVEAEQFLLNQKLDQLAFMDDQIETLEKKIASLFLQTEGAVLLSVPGVGLTTGAELYAEMGDPSDMDHAGQMIKMAGTNPIVKQSGDRRPSYHAISKQGRKMFRNAVFQAGKSLATNNPEMHEKYLALKGRGKYTNQAYIALGNRMIRLAFSMIMHQTLYHTTHESYCLRDQIRKKLSTANARQFYEQFVPTMDTPA